MPINKSKYELLNFFTTRLIPLNIVNWQLEKSNERKKTEKNALLKKFRIPKKK